MGFRFYASLEHGRQCKLCIRALGKCYPEPNSEEHIAGTEIGIDIDASLIPVTRLSGFLNQLSESESYR